VLAREDVEVKYKYIKLPHRQSYDIKCAADFNVLLDNIRYLLSLENIKQEDRTWLTYIYDEINPDDNECFKECDGMSKFVIYMNHISFNSIKDRIDEIFKMNTACSDGPGAAASCRRI
jgi:hypothetical protein